MSCMECLVFQKPQKWMGCWRLSVKHNIKLRLGEGIIASAIIDWSINSLNDDQRLCIDSLTCCLLRVSNCHPYNTSPRIQGIVTSTSKHSKPILFPTALWPSIHHQKKAVLSEKKRCAINPSTSKPIKLNQPSLVATTQRPNPTEFPQQREGYELPRPELNKMPVDEEFLL